jgi:hypothetical protein
MGYRPPTRIPVRMEIIKPSNGGPVEHRMIYEDDLLATAQPSIGPAEARPEDSGPAQPAPGPAGPADAATAPRDAVPTAPSETTISSASSASSAPSDPSQPPDFNRHARRCVVCSHPDRDAIEGDFIRWKSPKIIAEDYHIADRSSFYRHAHATGLFARRRREFARVLEDILECVEHSTLEDTADVIIRAARVYAHLDENGNWIEPTRTQIILTGPAPHELTGNPGLEIPAGSQSRNVLHEMSMIPAKKRTYTCKSKQALTEMTTGGGKAKKRLMEADHPSRMGILSDQGEPKDLSSDQIRKSKITLRARANKRLMETHPSSENGPTQ